MTRLVVHAGTHATGWAATSRQLMSWREALEEVGLHLHPLDRLEAWLADGYDLAAGAKPSAVMRAVDRAERHDADILLLSSERLEDSLRDPERVDHLASFADDLDMPLTVLVVLRDQLGYLNHLYAERISHLQMARDFPTFSADPSPAERFDYAGAFRLAIDSPDMDFVAVRYRETQPGGEAKSLLAAAGVAHEDLVDLPEGQAREELPGPVLLAAKRLLFKRLWRLGLITNLPRPEVVEVARRLSGHAEERRWDAQPFWGWDARSRETAIARFRPGNDVFAEAAWGSLWGDDWATGEFVDVDLAARNPVQVVDVLGAVDAIVQELLAAKQTDASE